MLADGPGDGAGIWYGDWCEAGELTLKSPAGDRSGRLELDMLGEGAGIGLEGDADIGKLVLGEAP